MRNLESLTEEDKNKMLLKQLAREEVGRRRSAKRAADNQEAGLTRVTVLVPREDAPRIREDAKRLRIEASHGRKHAAAVNGLSEQEQQLPLFEDPHVERCHIEWRFAGVKMPG